MTSPRAWALFSLLGVAAIACAERQSAAPTRAALSAPLEFAFGTLEGGVLSARSLRGRVTLLCFVTTFDWASQEQARVLKELLHSHRPRLNVAIVALEPPSHTVLVETFKSSLELDFPVAMAEEAERAAFGPMLRLDRVPLTLILDAEGRIRFERAGLVRLAALGALARELEERRRGPG